MATCISCGKTFNADLAEFSDDYIIDDDWTGQKVLCPHCGAVNDWGKKKHRTTGEIVEL